MLESRGIVNRFLGGGAGLHADFLAGEVGKGLDRAVRLDDHHLGVVDVGVGELHVGLALIGDGEPVPDAVDLSGIQLLLLAVPVNRLGNQVDAEPVADLAGHIDIEADDLVLLVTEAHRRKGIVQTKDEPLRLEHLVQALVSGTF